MKYLKVLENEAAHQAFKNGSEYVEPHICYLKDSGGIRWKAYVPPPVLAGDVAYWDGSSVKTAPYSKWNTSLGTPVGVVVIPEGFAPDGKARIVSLLGVDASGNTSASYKSMKWNDKYVDTELTNLHGAPTTDNNGSTSTGYNNYGYLPSDIFSGTTSFVDPKAKYYGRTPMIPSPYKGEESNPEYYKETLSGSTNINAFSDFDGLSNTKILVDLGVGYVAANAAYKYNDGVSNLQWYLPAMGELGYLMSRFNEINTVLKALGGVGVDFNSNSRLWSSSELNNEFAYHVYAYNGSIDGYRKTYGAFVLPFSIL